MFSRIANADIHGFRIEKSEERVNGGNRHQGRHRPKQLPERLALASITTYREGDGELLHFFLATEAFLRLHPAIAHDERTYRSAGAGFAA